MSSFSKKSSKSNTSNASNDSPPSYSQAKANSDNGVSDSEAARRREEKRALPPGWERHIDPNTNQFFYVNVLSKPPRTIWVHPFDDPEFLRTSVNTYGFNSYNPKPVEPAPASSSSRSPKPPQLVPPASASTSSQSSPSSPKRSSGFLKSLSDAIIGTKEERAAAKENDRKFDEHRERMRQQSEEDDRKREEYFVNLRKAQEDGYQLDPRYADPRGRGGGSSGSGGQTVASGLLGPISGGLVMGGLVNGGSFGGGGGLGGFGSFGGGN